MDRRPRPRRRPLRGGGGNAGSNISTVPIAAYTSSGDGCCEASTKRIHDAVPSRTPQVYRDLNGSSHPEPVLWPPVENPFLATYTAAWFDIYLKADNGTSYELIYGHGPDALCEYQQSVECIASDRIRQRSS